MCTTDAGLDCYEIAHTFDNDSFCFDHKQAILEPLFVQIILRR